MSTKYFLVSGLNTYTMTKARLAYRIGKKDKNTEKEKEIDW